MTSKRQSKSQTDKEMLEQLGERLRGHLDEHTAAMVDDCLAIYRNNEFVIMVCGEVSVGKSSFLNTMSTMPFLLTDQRETTAAITYLRSVRHALAEAGHEVVVFRVSADSACFVVFFQSTEYVLEAFLARNGPISDAVLIALVWSP